MSASQWCCQVYATPYAIASSQSCPLHPAGRDQSAVLAAAVCDGAAVMLMTAPNHVTCAGVNLATVFPSQSAVSIHTRLLVFRFLPLRCPRLCLDNAHSRRARPGPVPRLLLLPSFPS